MKVSGVSQSSINFKFLHQKTVFGSESRITCKMRIRIRRKMVPVWICNTCVKYLHSEIVGYGQNTIRILNPVVRIQIRIKTVRIRNSADNLSSGYRYQLLFCWLNVLFLHHLKIMTHSTVLTEVGRYLYDSLNGPF